MWSTQGIGHHNLLYALHSVLGVNYVCACVFLCVCVCVLCVHVCCVRVSECLWHVCNNMNEVFKRVIGEVLSVQGTCHSDYKEEIMGCFGHHLPDWQFFLRHTLTPTRE